MWSDFLQPEYPEAGQEIDNTNICQVLLYYSEEETKEFKALCKRAMKVEYPADFQKANISDLLLKMLRDKYANI